MPLAALIADIRGRYVVDPRSLRLTGLHIVAILASSSLAWRLGGTALAWAAVAQDGRTSGTGPVDCRSEKAMKPLPRQPPGLVAGPTNMGVGVLRLTDHRVLGAPYHREAAGIMAVLKIEMARPDKAEILSNKAHVSLFACCPSDGETSCMRSVAPGGLLAQIARGRVPDYLVAASGERRKAGSVLKGPADGTTDGDVRPALSSPQTRSIIGRRTIRAAPDPGKRGYGDMKLSSQTGRFSAAPRFFAILLSVFFSCAMNSGARAGESVAARSIFGAKVLPAALDTDSIGFYAKGCLAGAVELPATGPTWQVMRPSRNRAWGNPALVRLIERLSRDAAARDGWPGLLVGDLSQPRGGPMLSGHASHQIGLDADIWLTPMPGRVLSAAERETMQPVSMVKRGTLELDPSTWTDARARLIMQAASYPQVQRIFVHPAIKKRLCDTWRGDRSNLGKVRPYWGHMSHMHIRIRCPANSPDCKPQHGIPAGDGCGRQLAWWFTDAPWKPAKPTRKPVKPHVTTLADLPAACRTVLRAPAATVAAADAGAGFATASAETPQTAAIPVPMPRPADR